MLAATGGGDGQGRVPEWQLTHPYPENREQDIRAQIQESGVSREGLVDRDEYLDHIDGLIYGDNPREGYFKGAHFYHPDLEFELDFPEGWMLINQSTAVAAVEPSEQAVMVLQVATEATDPTSALREFLAQEGMSGGPVRTDSDDGVERARAPFEATTEQGTVRGEAAFLRAGGGGPVYAILGYGSPQSWGAHAAAVDRSVSSFGVLTDDAVLDVEPWRLEIRTLPGTMSLNSYAGDATSPVELEELAGLNRVGPAEVLDEGTRIKWVVGEPFPGG
jgi:predicted Zn-dependent protease